MHRVSFLQCLFAQFLFLLYHNWPISLSLARTHAHSHSSHFLWPAQKKTETFGNFFVKTVIWNEWEQRKFLTRMLPLQWTILIGQQLGNLSGEEKNRFLQKSYRKKFFSSSFSFLLLLSRWDGENIWDITTAKVGGKLEKRYRPCLSQ